MISNLFNIRLSFITIILLLLILPINVISNFTDSSNKSVSVTSPFQVPPYLKVGDILFCEWQHYNTDPCWDHVALYIGDNNFIEATPVGNGVVRIIDGEWFTKYTKALCYGTVTTANDAQRMEAVFFAISQLGKPYQHLDLNKLTFNRLKDPSSNSESWYCTELIWAAYYHQKINLDLKGVPKGPVMPAEMCWDDDIDMYTSHPLNTWHLGMYVEWILYILNNPRT